MGSKTSTKIGGKSGIQGPKSNTDVRAARIAALEDAATSAMIGLVQTHGGGDPNALTVPWGGADSLGNDARSALGNMWVGSIGESAGSGGLNLTGIGDGGGGKYEGIDMGPVSTINRGQGNGRDFGPRAGSSIDRSGRGHTVESPRVSLLPTTVTGRLPSEVIQRIVRQNFGRFRLCYENGLRNNPNLTGRVAVRFVIGRDGAVSSVGNGGSDMPDSNVVSCVARAFYGLSFPQPEDGIVTVVYPIMFTPGH
jgi:hypothetical protein